MKIQKLKEDIEKLKKYNILKTNRKKIDDTLKYIDKLTSELNEKQNNYNQLLDTNQLIKEETSNSEKDLNKYNKITKLLSYPKYKKIKDNYTELSLKLKEALSIEENSKLEISLLEKKINTMYNNLSNICGFEFTKDYYNSFLEEFRDKQYYNINLIDLINKKEEELSKYV